MRRSEASDRYPTAVFLKLAAVCWGLVLLSAVSAVVGGVQNNVQVFEIGVVAVFLSLAGVSVSFLGYTVRSFRQQQWLKRQKSAYNSSTSVMDIIRAFKIAGKHSEELNDYQKRVQKTVIGFVLSLLAGALPFHILSSVLVSLLSL